ncbi:MAG: HAMP domain-containing sensor histidine kinase, partial [Verrucomicrobia bacterium]|nr:HAMP domain-containing sensor histidine kinase [Verrucomicrobiota bacterium]
ALQEARKHLEKRVAERTQELKSAQSQLMEASRRAGMAEIASNVLHNVGNALNSVNVSCTLVADSMKRSKVVGLAKVAALLREHQGDLAAFITSDPGGQQLAVYLAHLSENLSADREAAIQELNSLQRNIEHIKEIVAMQQSYARVAGVKEMINIVALVEDSLRMNEVSLGRHGVEVVREFETVPPINADKHAILQILVNLVRNAKYACDAAERVDKRLTVRVGNGEGRIKISVSDNGVGIPPQNLTLIFNHGFTTREGGHGFGLHSSALAAQEMGGSLIVHSDGPGQGATFTLELPVPIPDRSDLPP